jgi:hypothetical protein
MRKGSPKRKVPPCLHGAHEKYVQRGWRGALEIVKLLVYRALAQTRITQVVLSQNAETMSQPHRN